MENNSKPSKDDSSTNSNIHYIRRVCECCGIKYHPVDRSRYCIKCSQWIYKHNNIAYEDLYV